MIQVYAKADAAGRVEQLEAQVAALQSQVDALLGVSE